MNSAGHGCQKRTEELPFLCAAMGQRGRRWWLPLAPAAKWDSAPLATALRESTPPPPYHPAASPPPGRFERADQRPRERLHSWRVLQRRESFVSAPNKTLLLIFFFFQMDGNELSLAAASAVGGGVQCLEVEMRFLRKRLEMIAGRGWQSPQTPTSSAVKIGCRGRRRKDTSVSSQPGLPFIQK